MGRVMNYEKGRRLLSVSDLNNCEGEYIYLDSIIIPKAGVSLTEQDFKSFEICTVISEGKEI